MAATAPAALGEHRAEIDAPNVFPVPDGDTGTNLFLTAESAAQYVEELYVDGGEPTLAASITAYAQGALLGARGNSGSSPASYWESPTSLLTKPPSELVLNSRLRSRGSGRTCLWRCGRPVEGTVLTVARAAALAAGKSDLSRQILLTLRAPL